MVTRVTVIYHPLHGLDFRVNFYVPGAVVDPTNAAIVAILAAINACTRAVAIEIELTVINPITASATVGAFYVSEDKGQFNFSDENGRAHAFKVPGIKAAILDTNKETINLTATGVPAYIAAVIANATGRGGAAIDGLVSAHRTENRKLLKSAPAI